MSEDRTTHDLLRAVRETGKPFYVFVIPVIVLALGLLISMFYILMTKGHTVTGLATPVGAPWGLLVASIVFFIGVSHVGIGVSAATRLLNLESLRPYARIAELLTLVCLPAAVILIAIDLGRPDRFIVNVMQYGNWTSPMLWSATVISVYMVGSSIYLYLSMRRDLALCAERVPGGWRKRLYRVLSLGYEDTDEHRHRHERTLWWVALLLLPIMVSVHSVYGFIFGLQAGRAGWFNAFMAPYFVLGALVNGFAVLIIVAFVVRRVFGWEQYLSLQGMRSMGRFLAWATIIYIYFTFAEYLTMNYAAPAVEQVVGRSLLTGSMSGIFWPTMVALLIGYFLLFFNQTVFHHQFNLGVTVAGAAIIGIVLFVTRYLVVVPSLLHPLLPYPEGTYTPTLAEWGTLAGVIFFAIAAYTIFMKLFPMIELPSTTRSEVTEK